MEKADLKAALLALDVPREPVDGPWDLGGAKLYVRGLTAAEKDGWVAAQGEGWSFSSTTSAELVCMTLVDEDGERVFTDSAADVEAVGGLPAKVVTDLFQVAMRLSGMGEETEDEIAQGLPASQNEPSVIG